MTGFANTGLCAQKLGVLMSWLTCDNRTLITNGEEYNVETRLTTDLASTGDAIRKTHYNHNLKETYSLTASS